MLALILRVYSAAYHLLLGGFLLLLGVFCLVTGTRDLNMTMLPLFKGPWIMAWVLALGCAGVLCAALALLGKSRVLLFAWSVVAFLVMVHGFFIGPHIFRGAAEAQGAGWLCLGAFIAIFGAWLGWKKAPERRY
jgi:hypothetical protein